MDVLGMLIEKTGQLTEQVYRHLRRQILIGQIEPGSKIVESKIAKELVISRSPLREAIRRLEQEGLVVVDQGSTTLFKPSQKDFEDLYQVRRALEPMAARLATENITEKGIKQLETTLRKTDKYLASGTLDGFIESNAQFHDLIAQYSNNQRLQKMLEEISALARYYRYICFKIFERHVDSAEEHWQIFRAIRARDERLAWSLMTEHLEVDLRYIHSIPCSIE